MSQDRLGWQRALIVIVVYFRKALPVPQEFAGLSPPLRIPVAPGGQFAGNSGEHQITSQLSTLLNWDERILFREPGGIR